MKALTKIMTIALVLNFMLIDIADARPRAPKSTTRDAIEGWCNETGGEFSGQIGGPEHGCYRCEFTGFGNTEFAVYTCCTSGSTTTCAWTNCVKYLGLNYCRATKPADVLANIYLELTRSAETKVRAQPDLVPLPTPASVPPEGFCRRNNQGQLLVSIYNQGGVDAAATKTRVQFGSAAPTDFDTPAVSAGKGTELVIPIPNACFDANNKCAFTIGADATAAAAEANEINNNAAGLCGPQFF